MGFGAWFRVADATFPLTARSGQKRPPFHRPPLLGIPLPRNNMKRRIPSTEPCPVRKR